MIVESPYMVPLRTLPYPDFICASRSKSVLGMVIHQSSHPFLVIGECINAPARSYVPQANHFVMWARNQLRFVTLRNYWLHDVSMARQTVNLRFRPHVPQSDGWVSTACSEQIEGRMEGQGENARQVTVILPNHLVLLQIPTLYLLVLAARKQIWVSIWHCQPTHCVNVPSQSHHEFSFNKVPKFDGPIVRTRDKESILRVDSETAHPPIVPADDCLEFPGRMPFGFNYFALSQNQRGSILIESVVQTDLVVVVFSSFACYILRLWLISLLLFNFNQCFLGGHAHLADLVRLFRLFDFRCFILSCRLVEKAWSRVYVYVF